MYKLQKVIGLSVAAGLLLTGCGQAGDPEIIMPDTPMQPSAAVSGSVAAEPAAAGEAQTEPDAQAQGQTAGSGEAHTVYLITMDLADSYWQSIDKGCRQAADELGNITYKWIGPDTHDDALQSACIDQAVSEGAEAILIAANSAEGVNGSLQKASEAGCKIIYVDSAASFDCVTALATDNEAAGKTAADSMKAALAERGITSGTIGVMGVTQDTASCVARETGFRAAFEGTDFVLADTVYMMDDAANVRNAVTAGQGAGYVAYFGTNEGTSVAIGDAVKTSGRDDLVVGFDTSDAMLALIADGTAYATMQQNPERMGHDGMVIAVQAIEGTYTDTNTKTDTGVTVITADSM
ncbi:MAG: substrate-binding domain-containing protein [Lachnospiraceae bacterium]|nr:substrate-binding domain-containing protein [Lachnospiraceae bacterium]